MSKPKSKNSAIALAILLVIVVSLGGVLAYQRLGLGGQAQSSVSSSQAGPSSSDCSSPLGGQAILRTQLPPPSTFGGVSEFSLPTPLRNPNAPTVAPDGSVWFAEQSVAGLAHFFPANRTLVEYAWPYSYPTPPNTAGICGNKSDVWGVALWNGKVWASDTTGNQLVAIDPSNGKITSVRLHVNTSYPYTLTVGPDNNLWFTELFASKLGELMSNGSLREFTLPGGINAVPAQIIFANSTTGYYADVGQGSSKGGIYSFNPENFAPALVGGQKLNYPSSVALASRALWAPLHGSSSVGSYNFTTKSWSYYPTTPVPWNSTTLPYFAYGNGSSAWVNEHYGNRIARIDPRTNSLAEYSEYDGPTNASVIGNAVTFAVGGNRAWFTEWSGNVLGYVDAAYDPGFYTSVAGNSTVVMGRGTSANVTLVIHDTTHHGQLNLSFGDSETLNSRPRNLSFSVPAASLSPPVGGQSAVKVTIAASQSLVPGTYYAILTATDGLTYESSFLKIVVAG